MANIEAELKRRDELDALQAWKIVTDAKNALTSLSDPVVEFGLREALGDLTDAATASSVIGLLKFLKGNLATDAAVQAVDATLQGIDTKVATETTLQGVATENTLLPIHNRFSVKTGTPAVVNASGDTVLHTPAAGKRIRWSWVGLVTVENSASVEVTLGFGTGGGPITTEVYKLKMGKTFAFAHGMVREGAVDQDLTINLSAGSQPVYVNYDLEEF